MSMFFMLGKYTSHATQGISKARTRQVASLIKECGGEMKSVHGLLGTYDLAIFVDFPSNEVAMRSSLSLTKMTGILFSTLPAVSVNDFDELIEDI